MTQSFAEFVTQQRVGQESESFAGFVAEQRTEKKPSSFSEFVSINKVSVQEPVIKKQEERIPFPKTPGMKIIDWIGEKTGLKKLIYGGVGGLYGAAGKTFGAMANVVDEASRRTGIPKSDLFRKLEEQYGVSREVLEKQGLPGVAGKVASGLGGAAFDISTIMALGPLGLPIHGGLMGAAEALPGGLKEAAKGGAVGAASGLLTHKILGGIGLLPSKARIPAFVGLGAAITPGDIQEKTAGALTWAALGLSGGNKKLTIPEFLEIYPKLKGRLDNRFAKRIIKGLNKEVTAQEIEEAGGGKAVLDEVAQVLATTKPEPPRGFVLDKGMKAVPEAEIEAFQRRGGKVEELLPSEQQPLGAGILREEKLFKPTLKKKAKVAEEKDPLYEILDRDVGKIRPSRDYPDLAKLLGPMRISKEGIAIDDAARIVNKGMGRVEDADSLYREIQNSFKTRGKERVIEKPLGLIEAEAAEYNASRQIPETKEIWAGVAPSPEAKTIVTKVAHKIRDVVQIEPQFKEIGGENTGLALKTYNSKRNMFIEQAEVATKELSKAKITDKEFTDLTWAATKESTPSEISTQLREPYKKVRKFFDVWKEREKKAGIFKEGFPEDQKRIMRAEREDINIVLKKKDLAPERRKVLRKQLKEIQGTLVFLEKAKVQYVHIPRTWLEGLFEKDPVKARGVLTEFFAERKTFDMETLGRDLVERGLLDPKELDIRRIMGAYAHKASHKIAISEIFNSAKKDGLLRLEKDSPANWQYMPKSQFPSLRGYKAHPVLAEYFERNFSNRGVMVPDTIGKMLGINVAKILGPIKMAQFYNPVFLPMYDVYQAWWTGSVRSKHTFSSIKKAFKSMKDKDQAYWDAHYWGTFSTPFTPGFKTYMKRVQRMVDGNSFIKRNKKYLNPYVMSWELAWKGDNFIRMITNHHYLEKGFTPREASRLTAKAHADYAGIPPSTRRVLNKWLFTPSFKISMMSAQAEMVASAGKFIIKGGKIPRTQKAMAKMLVGLTSGILLRNLILQDILGFKSDKWGLKYSKEIDTDEGRKEIVVHMSSPDNVILRFLHRFNMKEIVNDPDILKAVTSRVKWELHPLWQWTHEMLTNQSTTFEPIYNSFDEPEKIMKDVGIYTIRRLIKFTEIIPGMDTSTKRRDAQRALVKDIGKVGHVLNLFSLSYIRSPAERRIQYKIQRLTSFFKTMQREKPPRTPEESARRVARYQKKLQDLLKEFRND